MKICPQCNATYTDDTLNFCLEDGSVLTHPTANEPPPTVMVTPPRSTSPGSPYGSPSVQSEVPTAPSLSPPKRKSSKTWIWVIGILFGVMTICGGGFVGLILLVPDEPVVETTEKPRKDDSVSEKGDSNGDPDRTVRSTDDLEDWTVIDNEFIKSKYRNGALELTSVTDYFYVVLTKSSETYDASVLLTVSNTSGKRTNSGYGLVFHSYPGGVLEKDYAFLIRSDNGTYRIVQHTKKKENDLVKWTKSDAIQRGTAKNDLEVRAYGREMSFYINGEFVKKLTDYVNYKEGVAGIYTSDDVPIAFSKLEIRK